MTITFTMTAGELVTQAMNDRQVLAGGRTPTAWEMSYGLSKLNQLLKTLAADQVTPWAATEATATITGGDPDVTLSPRPAEVISVGLVVSATNERPLARWEIGQYDVLPNKAAVGDPVAYIVREVSAGIDLRVWPVPATNKTLNYRYVAVPEDVAQASAVDLPQRYIGDIQLMLAVRLTTFQNHNPDLPALAALAERRVYDAARPGSYFFEPACA